MKYAKVKGHLITAWAEPRIKVVRLNVTNRMQLFFKCQEISLLVHSPSTWEEKPVVNTRKAPSHEPVRNVMAFS